MTIDERIQSASTESLDVVLKSNETHPDYVTAVVSRPDVTARQAARFMMGRYNDRAAEVVLSRFSRVSQALLGKIAWWGGVEVRRKVADRRDAGAPVLSYMAIHDPDMVVRAKLVYRGVAVVPVRKMHSYDVGECAASRMAYVRPETAAEVFAQEWHTDILCEAVRVAPVDVALDFAIRDRRPAVLKTILPRLQDPSVLLDLTDDEDVVCAILAHLVPSKALSRFVDHSRFTKRVRKMVAGHPNLSSTDRFYLRHNDPCPEVRAMA